ncbi:MAG: triose-phosphate isomerase [Epsilonproteobacteria bacterium]|nr:triose-phosphate isomerase [Campylobacterota bacterium]
MIFAANFKMNHTRSSTVSYLKELKGLLATLDIQDSKIFIFPPATALIEDRELLIGAQNAFFAQNGAYTGEIGLEQLREFNINTLLIGHSERREILKESQEFIAKKYQFFSKHNFNIIYCIGEPLEVRKKGKEALEEFLLKEFEGIDLEYKNLIVAYEPIWAIGTGVSAKIEDIKEVADILKKYFDAPLLYGGSVKSSNIKDIMKIDKIDGVLVGSASLKADEFFKIIKGGIEVKR